MRYMMIVKGDEDFTLPGPPPQALMEAIGQLGEAATRAGKMVSMGGLKHSSKGANVRIKDGKIVVTDGPFAEAKEIIGGFAIMDLASREEAIEEGRKFMDLHRIHWPGWDGQMEIREMDEGDERP